MPLLLPLSSLSTLSIIVCFFLVSSKSLESKDQVLFAIVSPAQPKAAMCRTQSLCVWNNGIDFQGFSLAYMERSTTTGSFK